MSTTDWPSAITPAAVQWQLQKAGTQFVSPFNGTTQAVDYVAERWQASISLPPARSAGAVAALLNNLAGGVNRVNLWHHGSGGQPAGTLRGAPTLGAGAARGDATLTLAGCTGGNLLQGGGFELDANTNLIADGWVIYSSGSVTAAPDGLVPGNGSAWAQRLTASAMGTTTSDHYGVRQAAAIPVTVGQTYTLAVDVKCNTASLQVRLWWDWRDGSGTVISHSDSTTTAPTSWTRLTATGMAPASAASAMVYVWMQANTSGSTPRIELDNAQFAAGEATAFAGPATLLAGDMIGCSGHLLQVASDCTANDVGAMTVPLVNRVRSTIATSTAVTWYRPTAQFIMPAMAGATMQVPGYTQGAALDLVEVY